MNEGNNYSRATGTVNRNTYYNMQVPEWRCENCGKFNQREARFCRNCGAPGPLSDPVANTGMYVAEMPKKKGGAGKWIAIIVAIVVVVAAGAFAVLKFVIDPDDNVSSTTAQTQTGSANESSAVTSSDDVGTTSNANQSNTAAQESNQEAVQSSSLSTTQDSYYVPGSTYYVQPSDGVNVRVGPGTNYDFVYNQSTGKKNALRQGTAVVCEGLSEDGNWMKISQGWICIWDGNETLVR